MMFAGNTRETKRLKKLLKSMWRRMFLWNYEVQGKISQPKDLVPLLIYLPFWSKENDKGAAILWPCLLVRVKTELMIRRPDCFSLDNPHLIE